MNKTHIAASWGVALSCFLLGGVLFGQAKADTSRGAALALDFLIQNVCANAQGKVLMGVSPIDGDSHCITQRDLEPGEQLTYHKREWPAGSSADVPGQQRSSDSFPARTHALGLVAIHLYDYRPLLPGHPYGQYDRTEQIGGGTIAVLSKNSISFVATQNGRQNLQLFVGAGCRPGQPVRSAVMQDSWFLAPLDRLAAVVFPKAVPNSLQQIAGGVVSSQSGMVEIGSSGATCPKNMSIGSTRWYIAPVTYRATYRKSPLIGTHVRLWSLISERTGISAGARDGSIAFERAYFTRELGWTRWEAWKTTTARYLHVPAMAWNGPGPNQRVLDAQNRVVRRGNCKLPTDIGAASAYTIPTAPVGSNGKPLPGFALVGCVEVTDIVPPLSRKGDPPPLGPGTWYHATAVGGPQPGPRLFGP